MSRKILYVCHRIPYPPNKGDRIRNYYMLKRLAELGEVDLFYLSHEEEAVGARQALLDVAKRVVSVRLGIWKWGFAVINLLTGLSVSQGVSANPIVRRALKTFIGSRRYDVAVASSSSIAPLLASSGIAASRRIVDFVDLDSAKWGDYAKSTSFPMNVVYRNEEKRIAKLEAEICEWADAIALVNPLEQARLKREQPRANVLHITNGVDLEYFHMQPKPPADGGFNCVFVGAMDYYPNVDGILWFVENVWRDFSKNHENAQLIVVGRNPAPEVEAIGKRNDISVTGTVDDVRPFLEAAHCVIAPLRIARGIQNKVLESMAMGKATIVSPAAFEGIAAEPNSDLLLAESPKEWLEHLESIHKDPTSRERLERRARTFVETRHNWKDCLTGLPVL